MLTPIEWCLQKKQEAIAARNWAAASNYEDLLEIWKRILNA